MLGDKYSMGDLFNFWNSENNINTFRSYIAKYPLLNDGANSGGTQNITTGTAGTVTGTSEFYPQSKWSYVLQSITRTAVQSGTFGTINITGMLLNGITLGTAGNISDFATLYGEDLTLYGTYGIAYRIDCGTGVIGTFSITEEFVGWKFKTIN